MIYHICFNIKIFYKYTNYNNVNNTFVDNLKHNSIKIWSIFIDMLYLIVIVN